MLRKLYLSEKKSLSFNSAENIGRKKVTDSNFVTTDSKSTIQDLLLYTTHE